MSRSVIKREMIADVNNINKRSGSVLVERSNSAARPSSGAPAAPEPAPSEPAAPKPPLAQEPITDDKMRNLAKTTIEQCLNNNDNEELVRDVKHLFPSQYHAAVISEILNFILEK